MNKLLLASGIALMLTCLERPVAGDSTLPKLSQFGVPNGVDFTKKVRLKDWLTYLDSVEQRSQNKQISATDYQLFIYVLNPDQNRVNSSFPELFSVSAFVFHGTSYQAKIATACEALLKDSKSTDWTKAWCAECLSIFGNTEDLPYMLPLLEDPDPQLRKVVTRSMKRLGYQPPDS